MRRRLQSGRRVPCREKPGQHQTTGHAHRILTTSGRNSWTARAVLVECPRWISEKMAQALKGLAAWRNKSAARGPWCDGKS